MQPSDVSLLQRLDERMLNMVRIHDEERQDLKSIRESFSDFVERFDRNLAESAVLSRETLQRLAVVESKTNTTAKALESRIKEHAAEHLNLETMRLTQRMWLVGLIVATLVSLGSSLTAVYLHFIP